VSDDRAIFKTKLQEFNNFKKMSGDPLGGVNHSDVFFNIIFRMVGTIFLKIMS
jgi:hypothetical protein